MLDKYNIALFKYCCAKTKREKLAWKS